MQAFADTDMRSGDLGADTRLQALLQWLDENGATVNPASTIAEVGGLRGLYATQPLKRGAVLMHLPRKLLITLDVAKSSPCGKRIAASGAQPSDYGYVAAFLIEVRRDGGFWKPFVDALPETAPDASTLFTCDELEYLRGSYTMRMIKLRRKRMAQDYRCISRALPESMRFGFDEFLRAYALVRSRTFGVTIDGTEASALVPLADMANHAAMKNATWSPEAADGFSIVATQDIFQGAQVTLSYGSKCNGCLLLAYGFCIPQNDYNRAEIELDLPPADHPFRAQLDVLGSERSGRRAFWLPSAYDAVGSQALLSLLRAGSTTDLPALRRAAAGGAKIDEMPAVSRSNEAAAMKTLATACEESLGRFRSTIDEDNALLATGMLPHRLRNAVTVRREEKIILTRYLRMAREALALLQREGAELAGCKGTDAAMAPYFRRLSMQLRAESPAVASAH
jgi:histone-lysine N-methyltransferase SETD3